MRKLFIAMLGLMVLARVAPVAAAPSSNPTPRDLPLLEPYTPAEDRGGKLGQMYGNKNYQSTLSGTLLRSAAVATTTFLYYEGACAQRAAGTWTPKSDPQADSLNTIAINQRDPYTENDQSANEILWHVVDAATPIAQRPGGAAEIIVGDGSRALWMGKFDANFGSGNNGRKAGYPNVSYQILYVDTQNGGAAHAGNYNLTFDYNCSSEFNYDFVWFIGGGAGAQDPLGQSKSAMLKVTNNFLVTPDHVSDAGHDLLLQTTGAILPSTIPGVMNTVPSGGDPVNTFALLGDQTLQPVDTYGITLTVEQEHRALYIVFRSDCLASTADGNWPTGNGVVIDNLATSDRGIIYDQQASVGIPETTGFNGTVIRGTAASPIIAARVGPGFGPHMIIKAGDFAATSDACAPQKNVSSDHFFYGADPITKDTFNHEFLSVVGCTFPIPSAGVASVFARWGMYVDLPTGSGMTQDTEFRFFKAADGWSAWKDSTPGQGSVLTGSFQTWLIGQDELAEATQADSVQLRYTIRCIEPFAASFTDCTPVRFGVLYDDFSLRLLTGVPAPIFDVFQGSVAQTTFVDGTMGIGNSLAHCPGTPPCWPGVRGSALTTASKVLDNWNSPLGDSIIVTLATGLRQRGLGINWLHGFDKQDVTGGRVIRHQYQGHNAGADVPRLIFRLFDPASRTWSPWDSTELDADNVNIAGTDTTIVNSRYRANWPPRDKVLAGASVPAAVGGWPGSIGGFKWGAATRSAYSDLAFLPRGTRMQYYFKAVDVAGGVSYQFQSNAAAREVDNLPNTPGSPPSNLSTGPVVPDIITWEVLPGTYDAGHAGTLLQGETRATVLNWDDQYTSWDYQQDPITQALRALGVRADRYRYLQGLGEGNNVGGHAFANDKPRERGSNFFPNMNEYSIRDSLSAWYRIMLVPTHDRTTTVVDDQDARLLRQWWISQTDPLLYGNGSGANGGDRCVWMDGDDAANMLTNPVGGTPDNLDQPLLATDVFGVNSVTAGGAWTGAITTPYPTMDDQFSAANTAAGLAAPGTFTYPVDGGCSGIGGNQFDGLFKVGSAEATVCATFPGGVSEAAGIMDMSERDGTNDSDNSKSVAYGYSIQFVRQTGIPTTNANYVHSGVENRMRVLFKFLTSCRAGGVHAGECWPCPTDPAFSMSANWRGGTADAAFQTTVAGAYGSLYPIQDNQLATGVEPGPAAPKVNRLEGNFPNPFNPETAIRFSSATSGKVTIRIFNVAGQVVHSITKNATQGPNEVRWNGKSSDGTTLASGIYFYRVRFADGTETASRMALLK